MFDSDSAVFSSEMALFQPQLVQVEYLAYEICIGVHMRHLNYKCICLRLHMQSMESDVPLQRLQLVKDLNILLHWPGAITYLIHVSA